MNAQTMTHDQVREVAVAALGRISVDLFQPGNAAANLAFDTPGFDYLLTRTGDVIGYGELADRFAAALDVELT